MAPSESAEQAGAKDGQAKRLAWWALSLPGRPFDHAAALAVRVEQPEPGRWKAQDCATLGGARGGTLASESKLRDSVAPPERVAAGEPAPPSDEAVAASRTPPKTAAVSHVRRPPF